MSRNALLVLLITQGLLACSDPDPGAPPVFPEDYAATYQEVRSCRLSVDHDLTRMRVLASPDAVAVYQGRTAPFPAGGVVLKEQYDAADTACAGPIVEFTVMQKQGVGASPEELDWTWQKVSPDHRTLTTEITRCVGCHTACGEPPEGHDGTCTVP